MSTASLQKRRKCSQPGPLGILYTLGCRCSLHFQDTTTRQLPRADPALPGICCQHFMKGSRRTRTCNQELSTETLIQAGHLHNKRWLGCVVVAYQRARLQTGFVVIDGGDTKRVTAHCAALPQALTSAYLMLQDNVIFQSIKTIKPTNVANCILHVKYLDCSDWTQANESYN